MKHQSHKTTAKPDDSESGIRLQQTLYNSSNPTRRWLHRLRYTWLKKTLDRYCSKRPHLAIDLGTGIGTYLPCLAEKYDWVIGLDINPAFLEEGKNTLSRKEIVLINGDARFLPLRNDCADLVVCSEVLEHIKEARLCLQEIHRILKPGGRLLLSTPQPFSLLELTARIALSPVFLPLARLVYREPVYPTGHINLMSTRKIRALLVEQEFCIDAVFRSGLYLPFFAELFGTRAQAVAAMADKKIRHSPLAPLLWTQFYIATKKKSS